MEGSTTRSSSSNIPCLTQDLIVEIFLRLPVRSLVRFCCVCKSWQNLITSNQDFIRRRLQISHSDTKNNPGGRKNVIVNPVRYHSTCCERHSTCSICGSIKYTDPQGMSLAREIASGCGDSPCCRVIIGHRNFNPAGCCDGIICFYLIGDCRSSASSDTNLMIYLCNPVLNQCRLLPRRSSSNRIQSKHLTQDPKVCFIFDAASQDYKVLIIRAWSRRSIMVDIYSLSNDSWTVLRRDAPDHPIVYKSSNKHLDIHNGRPHWLTGSPGAPNWVLNVLDITEGKISEIPLPDCLGPLDGVFLDKYEGSLLIFRRGVETCEYWWMKEDNVGVSWEQQDFTDFLSFASHPCTTPCPAITWCRGKVSMDDVENEETEECTTQSEDVESEDVEEVFIYCVASVRFDYFPSLISIMPPAQSNTSN